MSESTPSADAARDPGEERSPDEVDPQAWPAGGATSGDSIDDPAQAAETGPHGEAIHQSDS